MASPFFFEIQPDLENRKLEILLFGVIDQNSKPVTDQLLKDILEKANSFSSLHLQLDKVENMNSYGIRVWVLFLKDLQERFSVSFGRVSDVIVDRASVFPLILGNPIVKVKSFAVPYYCKKCNEQVSIYFESEDFLRFPTQTFQAPEMKCQKCHQIMEFDDLEKTYTNFLKFMVPLNS